VSEGDRILSKRVYSYYNIQNRNREWVIFFVLLHSRYWSRISNTRRDFYSMSFPLIHVTLVLTPGWDRHLLLTTSNYIPDLYFVVIVDPQNLWQFSLIDSVVVSSKNRFLHYCTILSWYEETWKYFPYTISFLYSPHSKICYTTPAYAQLQNRIYVACELDWHPHQGLPRGTLFRCIGNASVKLDYGF
jgi:hypothetical protein